QEEIHIYGEAREENVEWRFLAQVRILTTINEAHSSLRVVDYDIFEFSNRTKPLILINRDHRLSHIRLEIRYVNQFYEKLPNFVDESQSGDLLLNFDDGKPSLKVHSSLLALYSPLMAKNLEKFQTSDFLHSGQQAELDMKDCDRADFIEVLYQIYSQARPLWADFRRLSRGAVAYQVLPIMERIIKHLIEFDMPIIQKIKEAVKLGVEDAIGELAFTAEKLGIWSYLIGTGFDPKSEFGDDIYHRLICPAILQAKRTPHFARYRSGYKLTYSLENPSEMEMPFVVPLKVSGKTFFVNKGILQLYNDSELATGNNGERYFRINVDLSKYLESKDLTIQQVIEAMLQYMNPQNHRMKIEFVRPVIMIAYEHKMFKLVKEMEQFLVDEPPMTSELLLDQLVFAQKFDLKNVIGQTLLRIEVNFVDVAYNLIETEIFKKHISKDLQNKIMDRIVSGWGQSSWRLADCIPTKKLRRFIEADDGGPISNHDADLVTFNDINSHYAFGEPHDLPVKLEQQQ
uniref:BTB domain-containing protein n=1 Tax=Panagrolaimus sp. ES5 TaxID=591445 RepID=A0AC34GX87_9BILA